MIYERKRDKWEEMIGRPGERDKGGKRLVKQKIEGVK